MTPPAVKSCIIIILLFSPIYLLSDSLTFRYYSPQNIQRFADYLYHQADYLRAAGEYQRYLFAVDTLPLNTDSVFFRIGQCYRKNNNFEKGIDYFRNIIEDNTGPQLTHQAHYQIALCYFLLDRFEQSEKYLKTNLMDTTRFEINDQIQQLRALNSIQQKHWGKASAILSRMDRSDEITADLIKFAYIGQNLPRKNKTLAGLYSAVVPGLGKFYCNRQIDGLQSLFSTAILGWQAYDGFHKDGVSSMKGWIFSTIGGLFYLGNIYGSVVAAEIYNEEREEQLMTTIKVYLNVHFD